MADMLKGASPQIILDFLRTNIFTEIKFVRPDNPDDYVIMVRRGAGFYIAFHTGKESAEYITNTEIAYDYIAKLSGHYTVVISEPIE